MALYGLDLSHYQATNTVDQAQDFVILKATEGYTDSSGPGYVDPDCDNKYQRAKAQGKLLGVYGYAIMLNAVNEATFFVQNVQGYIGEALLVLDNETHTDVQWALTWLNTVYALTQVKPLIYMSASTARAVDWSPVYNAGYALWVAGYPPIFNVANPGVPKPDGSDMPYATGAWPFATIWQYSSSAGSLDRDIAYMTAEAWHKFAQGDRNAIATPPTTQPTNTPDPTPPAQDQPTTQPAPSPSDTPTTPTTPDAPPNPPDPTPTQTGSQITGSQGTPKPVIGSGEKTNFWQKIWRAILSWLEG